MAIQTGLEIEVIGDKRLFRLLRQMPDQIDRATTRAIDRTLTVIERAQILKYTAGSHPSQPPNTKYIRTFRLQRSSMRAITRIRNPVEGRWWSDLDYAKYVIGERQDQAAIHAGRWMNLEEVTKEAAQALSRFINAEIDEVVKDANI